MARLRLCAAFLLLHTRHGTNAASTAPAPEPAPAGPAAVNAVRRAALATYGWGGSGWDGPTDPHGYGDCDQLRADLLAHGANSYNFLFYDAAGHDYLLAVQCLDAFGRDPLVVGGVPFTAWFTLIPPSETSLDNCLHNKTRACCSVPADSPLTPFNETALFNQSLGYRGCHDYKAWAHVVGRLSGQQITQDNIAPFFQNGA